MLKNPKIRVYDSLIKSVVLYGMRCGGWHVDKTETNEFWELGKKIMGVVYGTESNRWWVKEILRN